MRINVKRKIQCKMIPSDKADGSVAYKAVFNGLNLQTIVGN